MEEEEVSRMDKRRRAARKGGNENYASRRREIVGAAAIVFQNKDYDLVTLQDVAVQLATDRASLYYYFSGKEELLRAVVYEAVVSNVATVNQIAAADLPAAEKLHRFIGHLMASFEANYPHMYVFIAQDLRRPAADNSAVRQQLDELSREVEARFVEILEQGVRFGEFRADLPVQIVANAMFGMVNWTYRWFHPGRRFTAEEVSLGFAQLLLEGVAVRR